MSSLVVHSVLLSRVRLWSRLQHMNVTVVGGGRKILRLLTL